jgi:hypothetical protein
VAYDTRRQRLLLVGGTRVGQRGWTDEIDALDLSTAVPTWASLAPGGLGLGSVSAVYDSATDRLIAFGGLDSLGNSSQGVYSLELGAPTAWSRWTLADTIPPATPVETAPHLDLDATRRRLLFFHAARIDVALGKAQPLARAGAYAPDTTQVWALDLDGAAGWSLVPYAGRGVNTWGTQMVFDPVRDRYEVYGSQGRNDLWELGLDVGASWSLRGRSDLVEGGENMTALLDAAKDRLLILLRGGSRIWTVRRGPTDDWEFAGGGTVDVPSHPYGVFAFDPRTRAGYVFGGAGSVMASELGDLWRFTLDDTDHVTWTRLFPDGDSPSPRWGGYSVYDPRRHRIVLFGGWAGHVVDDTWELLLDPPIHWHQLPVRGTPPSGRYWGSAVYDSRRDAMIVNGGLLGYLWDRQLTDETWILSFADGDVWEPLQAFGSAPSPRYLHSAIYDPKRDRMLVFWGYAYNGGRNDCSELDLADGPAWRSYQAIGVVPQSRGEFAAVYDSVRDAALCMGGGEGGLNPAYFPPNQYIDFRYDTVQSPPAISGPPLALLGCIPNPTTSVETVAFDLPQDATVHARIYSASGRLVRDLGGIPYVAGRHLLLWDGADGTGARAASGVYFARLAILGRDLAGKFVLLH